jgi:hypothetical protein
MSRLPSALPVLLLMLSSCDSTSEPCEEFGVRLAPETSAVHVSTCSSAACGDGNNPPSAGPHCADTLSCRVHTTEQPRCAWLHNLEHGHAVFLYNCPEGCPDEVAKLEAAMQSVAAGGNGVRRALLAPDSQLPKRVAALLWRRSYVVDSADPKALECLLRLQDDAVVTPEAGLACKP